MAHSLDSQSAYKIQDVVKCGNSVFTFSLKDLQVLLRRYSLNSVFLVFMTWILSSLFVGVGAWGIFMGVGELDIFWISLGVSLIVTGLGVIAFWKLGFVKPARFLLPIIYKKRCNLKQPVYNVLDFLAKDSISILSLIAKKEFNQLKEASNEIIDVWQRGVLGNLDLKQLVAYYTKRQSLSNTSEEGILVSILKESLLWATSYAVRFKATYITNDLIFLGFLKTLNIDDVLSSQFQISLEDVEKIVLWHTNNKRVKFLHSFLNIFAPIVHIRGVADSWFIGFTFYISHMSTDIVEYLRYNPGVYNLAHPGLDQKLMEVLLKPVTPNVLLVGAPGTGKTSIVYGLAQRIVEQDVPKALLHKRIFAIDLNKMLSFVNEVGGVAQFMAYLENELKQSPEVIFFIDDIALLFEGSTQRELLLQLISLLSKYNVPIIATMTFADYAKFKVDYSTLAVNFEVIEVPESTEDAAYTILTTKIAEAEAKYHIRILFPALSEIIRLTKIYMPADKFPKKATVIFDKALAIASAQRATALTPEIVRKTIEDTVKIKIGVEDKEAINKLMHLEAHIHQRYVNQEYAVHELVEALKRARLQLADTKRPIGVFLFLGPTGVGKTYLAKIASEEFFGGQHRIIRVDLSQYKLPTDIPQILETLSQVRLSPYSLILLDEFEKAHPDIHDMFLRLFDEGVIKDSRGEELYFTNSLIVATSNVGSREILDAGTDYEKAKQIITALLPKYFKPELINRFDSVIIFRALTQEELLKVADLLMLELRLELDQKHIRLLWDNSVLKLIVKKSYDPLMGARPIRRFIEKQIKSLIANYILTYKSKHGKLPPVVDLRPHKQNKNDSVQANKQNSTQPSTGVKNSSQDIAASKQDLDVSNNAVLPKGEATETSSNFDNKDVDSPDNSSISG